MTRSLLTFAALLAGCSFDGAGLGANPVRGDARPLADVRDGLVVDRAGDSHRGAETAHDLPPEGAPTDTLAPDTLAPDTQPPPLFQDDFSSSGGLAAGSGSWSASGGVYKQVYCNNTPDSKVPGAQSWSDITASVDVYVDSLCSSSIRQAGVIVRVGTISGCDNYYYWCLVDFDRDEIRIGKMAGACSTSNWTGGSVPASLQTGTWYHVDFEASGNVMTCRLSGPGLSSPAEHTFTDSSSPYTSGSAGLISAGLRASFDNFVVRGN